MDRRLVKECFDIPEIRRAANRRTRKLRTPAKAIQAAYMLGFQDGYECAEYAHQKERGSNGTTKVGRGR
jgi:hypothetical protein